MSLLTYNGVSIRLGRLVGWDMHPVTDDAGVEVLYTKHTIHVQGVINPEATAGGIPNIPAMKQSLLTPRKKLSFSAGGAELLASPNLAGATVDAKNGPLPLDCRIVQFHGETSAIVDFIIETNLVDCTAGAGALLSHRFEMSESIDELFYSTRTVRGTAIFRSDGLQLDNLVPDDFRASLFFAPLSGYRRENVQVSSDPDGVRLHYSYDDVEQDLNLGLGTSVVKIAGTFSYGMDFTAATDFLPSLSARCVVEVWGGPKSARQDMVASAQALIVAMGFNFDVDVTAGSRGFGWHMDVDLVGKYARAEARLAFVGVQAAAAIKAKNALVGNNPTFGNDWPNVPNVTQNNTQNPPPPGGRGTRSDQLIRLVTEALKSSPCAKPAPPATPGTAKDVL